MFFFCMEPTQLLNGNYVNDVSTYLQRQGAEPLEDATLDLGVMLRYEGVDITVEEIGVSPNRQTRVTYVGEGADAMKGEHSHMLARISQEGGLEKATELEGLTWRVPLNDPRNCRY